MWLSVGQENKLMAERFRFTDHRMDRIAAPPQSSASEENHLHIHLDFDDVASRSGTTPRVSRRDNAGGPGEELPAPRRNGSNGAQPRVLARMIQNGEDGSWAATDAEGNPCEVRTGNDGALEIWHHPSEEQNGDADPDIVGEHPSPRDPGAAHDRRQRLRGTRALDQLTRTGHADLPYEASREFARRMAEAFAPRRAK
jgi:hypothetical protein